MTYHPRIGHAFSVLRVQANSPDVRCLPTKQRVSSASIELLVATSQLHEANLEHRLLVLHLE